MLLIPSKYISVLEIADIAKFEELSLNFGFD